MLKKNHLIFLLCLLFVYHSLIGFDPRGANDFPYSFTEAVREGFNIPLIWSTRFSDSLGIYTASTLWSYPLDFLYGFGAYFGIDFSVLMRFFGIIPALLIGFISIRKLLKNYQLDERASLIGSFFFLANTYFLLLIDGGQINLALAYSLLPGAFYLYKSYFFTNIWKKLYFILAFILLSVFDIRIIYFLLVLILLDFLFSLINEHQKVKRSFLAGMTTSVLTLTFFFGFHSYWILPSLFSKLPSLPENYTSQEQIDFLSFANLGHAFSLLSPHWYQNNFGQISPLIPYFFLITLLAFSSLILRPKDRGVAFWSIVAMASIFLSKGGNPPLPSVYKWLFTNIPGFFLFRDPVKFYFLIALSFSVLISMVSDSIISKFYKYKDFIFLSTILLLSAFAYPVYTGKMTGLFSPGRQTGNYFKLAELLKADKDFGRVLWIPNKSPFGYSSSTHPTIEALTIVSKRPFAIGSRGDYEKLNYIREATFMGELFDIAGIKYVVYPPLDLEKKKFDKDEIRYYYTFLGQISKRDWLEKRIENIPIPIFETKKHQQKIFLARNLWFLIGSDSIYEEATKSASLSLENNALVFIDETPGSINLLEKYPFANLTLYKKTLIDLAASFIPTEKIYSLASSLKDSPNENGWWKRDSKDLISFREFLREKYSVDMRDFDLNKGWAVAEGSLETQINLTGKRGDILLSRVYESSNSGEISFSQDNHEIGKINTKLELSEESNIRWREVGKIFSENPIIIKTNGSVNIINAIAVISEKDWISFKDKSAELRSLGRIKDFTDNNILPPSGEVHFSSTNSTKYKISVNGLKSPAVLILSQNYDPLWLNTDKKPLPVYSFLNGFPVTSDGEYIIEYQPQREVGKGLIISVFSLGLMVALVLFFKLQKRYNNLDERLY